MPPSVNYPQRLILDPKFVVWLKNECPNNSCVISQLLKINQSSKYHKKEHIIMCEEDYEQIVKEDVIKDKDILKGCIYSMSFREFGLSDEVIELIGKKDIFTKRILLGILLTDEPPYKSIILTNEKIEDYSEKPIFDKIKDLSVKGWEESITIISNFYRIFFHERELSDKAKKLDLEFKAVEDIASWATFQPEIAKKDGIEYHRKIGSNIIYKFNGEDFVCLDCGSEILAAKVAHPIHDGPFPLSGSGKCHYEEAPYCPKCEEKPSFHGSPITTK